ncbi:PHD and RING finger domain-containing protein 1 [Cheilinus undulatus]|uniref:PHD and RING finger domain-containing protein 1 n=1 Tax=Cheilinus undulatus TaxID=241271 RepID=UPI001BD3B068|nr:PHD and RING finger domain-containing protein 1 [Cheilinus undulatus]XP_041650494.1 PHD and RING finger domain-containing protein 1 [Cheilinus undulatus]
MDEDDSQDELINRSTSHNKGKRAALWAISDDSEDSEVESEEGASGSGEEEEEDQLDGDDDEDDDDEEEEEEEEGNEEEDDDEEEEDVKAEGGAVGGTSADLAGISSDEDTDKCPICLNSFSSQPVATPESCEHYFCLDCILEWAKNANSCPVDRIAFSSIYLRKCFGGKVKKVITVKKPVKENQEETIDVDLEQTNCEVCGGSDREDRLLLCDGCDAGYHMECLTPPLDSVPVEEWFCPECESNNRNSRGSAEQVSDTESLPSSAGPTTSRSQTRAAQNRGAGPTRAIARTQQSERVRANVNRNRITQARTSQLAPTYLMQSTWLDETINAVVAGLNTAVYVRNFTPRAPTRRRRKTGKRRKVKKTSASKGKKGKVASTGVKRRKRKVRRTKSRRKLIPKKPTTARSRIANNLGIVKDKKSSSLPTVYRPSEHTLSNMRADIGAASLSIYGDPFDLDPFTDREEEEQQAHVTSLLEAKRRGISRSALRSHQPVARPFTASLSRRAVEVPQSGVVEATPVPDLLGSILTGQSMLLMDSSDVVINRDGSLKAAKPIMPSAIKPSCSKSSSSGDSSTHINPVMSPSQGDTPLPLHHNGDLPSSSHSSMSRPFSQSSSRLPPYTPPSASRIPPSSHSDLPPRGHPSVLPHQPVRPTHPSRHRGTNPAHSSSSSSTLDSSSKNNQPKKGPIKPMWVDVSVLPRIPKIKRESIDGTNDGGCQGAGSSSNQSSRSSREHISNSSSTSSVYGMPSTGMNSLAGDKGRQQSVDQQKGRAEGPSQRQRPDGAASSSAFSNSFSSSSSSTGFPSSQSRYSSSSVASSSVSFRINSSGNSWHSRRLSMPSSSTGGDSMPEPWSKKEEEVKKRQLHRDKQMLLASRTQVKKEQDVNNIYDPFNPTVSDSSSSDDEAESSQNVSHEVKAPSLEKKEGLMRNKLDLIHVKSERQETEVSLEEPRGASSPETPSPEVRCLEGFIKTEKESRSETQPETQTAFLDSRCKKESGLDDGKEAGMFGHGVKSLNSKKAGNTSPVHHSLVPVKTERETLEMNEGSVGTSSSAPPNCKNDSSASSSAPTKKKEKAEVKIDVETSSKSPSRNMAHKKKTAHTSKERHSSSPETERDRRRDHRGAWQKEKEREMKKSRDRSSRRSRSRERKRGRSTSESSHSISPEKSRRKRQRSRSRSKDRRRSRSGSSSSSREHSRRKKNKQRSKERNDGRRRDSEKRRLSKDKRHGRSCSSSLSKSRSRSRSKDRKRGRSRSKSRSKSRTRSRSKERRKDHTRFQPSSLSDRDKGESKSKDKRRRRSRSSSRERRKDKSSSSSKSAQKTSGACSSSSKDLKPSQEKKKEKDLTGSSLKEEKTAPVNKEEKTAPVNKEEKTAPVSKEEKTAPVSKEEKTASVSKEEKTAPVNKELTPLLTAASKVKNQSKEIKTDSQVTTADTGKEFKVKEIKKEKPPSLDMFEDSPVIKPIKEEVFDTDALEEVKEIQEEGNKDDPVKMEKCEILIIKSEPSSPELHPLPPVTSFSSLTPPAATDDLKDSVPQPPPEASDPPNAVESVVAVKQEVQQPSDSDDDFNVDVMLDSLDYVKSEPTEGNATSVKQEKDVEEGKNEGEQVSAVVGAKSKTHVKRVTWNIQEPEGPQPEKSASKVALYKLKLKQEGLRRPSSASLSTNQDITGNVSDPSRKGASGALSSSSKSDGTQPEGLPTTGAGESEEGDVLSKDKQYLKKLHMQERAVEEVKLAIKPFYQRRDINKEEYKEILRKAVQKVCHSKSGEINPVKVGNLVKAYVDKYKHARKHKKAEEAQTEKTSNSP